MVKILHLFMHFFDLRCFCKKKKFLCILSITALLNYSCNIDDKYSKMKELYFRIYYNKMIIKVIKAERKIHFKNIKFYNIAILQIVIINLKTIA